MDTGIKMKRSNAVRKSEEHERANPFCAAHPEVSSPSPSTVQYHPDDAQGTFRKTASTGLRAHVRADHVVVARKKK